MLHVYLHQPNRSVLPENGIKWYINFKDITMLFEINSTCNASCKKSLWSGYILTVSLEVHSSSSNWSWLPTYCTEAVPCAYNQYSCNNIPGFQAASTLAAVWAGLHLTILLHLDTKLQQELYILQRNSEVSRHGENGLFIYKSALYGHHYTDSTYECVAPTHGELALTRLVLCTHMHL